MRSYGRIFNADGTWTWQVVETDNQGNNGLVYFLTLIQCLQLNLGESPFYANYGIPAEQDVVQQVFPDYYMALTQQQFAPYFASLTLAKVPPTASSPDPHYKIVAVMPTGQTLNATVSLPK